MSDIIFYLLIALIVFTAIEARSLGLRKGFWSALYFMVTTPLQFVAMVAFAMLFVYAVRLMLYDAPPPSLFWNIYIGSCERLTEFQSFHLKIYDPGEASVFNRLAIRLNTECLIHYEN